MPVLQQFVQNSAGFFLTTFVASALKKKRGVLEGCLLRVWAGPALTSGSIPGSGRSPGEGNGHPLQYSCLENPTDLGDWQAAVQGVKRVRWGLHPCTMQSLLQVPPAYMAPVSCRLLCSCMMVLVTGFLVRSTPQPSGTP